MAVTYRDLIEDVAMYVYGLGTERDTVTTLTAPATTASTTLFVDDARQLAKGFIEIDDECLAVKGTDAQANAVSIHSWGRGDRGTTAATHEAGARVTNNPRFPRTRIKAEIIQAAVGLWPRLWGIGTYDALTSRPAQVTYELPADCEYPIDIAVRSLGPSRMWQRVTRWRFDRGANLDAFPSGRSVDIYDMMPPGQPIKVVYRRSIAPFTSEADTMESVGMQDGWRDIVKWSAAAGLIMASDAARTQLDTIEAASRAEKVQPTAPTAVSRQLMALVETRIAEERAALNLMYPGSQVRLA